MLFALLFLKFTAATIGGNFRPSRFSANILAAYLKARAWMRCVSATFSSFVFFTFTKKEPAFITSFILFHFSPHEKNTFVMSLV
jgi:hypothetical protein